MGSHFAPEDGNTFPIIENGAPLPEVFMDGIYRIDDMGGVIHSYYYRFAKDPHINNGMIYRQPVLLVIRPKGTLPLSAGAMDVWLRTGQQPRFTPPPSLGGKTY